MHRFNGMHVKQFVVRANIHFVNYFVICNCTVLLLDNK